MAAAPKRVDEEAEIYTVDTVPPPDGEDSAYQAPTRVGPMARAAVVQMFAIAELTERAPESVRQEIRAAAPVADEPLPNLGDSDSDCSQLEPTGSVMIVESGVIASRARQSPPALPRPPRVPVFHNEPPPVSPEPPSALPPVRAWNLLPIAPAVTPPSTPAVRPRNAQRHRRLATMMYTVLPGLLVFVALVVGVPFLFAYLLSAP